MRHTSPGPGRPAAPPENMEPGGRVIWITGLSGAGKSTLARALAPLLSPASLLLDGDEMREALGLLAGGYERADRLKLALTYARLCRLAAAQGQTVICSTISLFHEVHEWNRANLPGYFEVFLDPPAGTLEKRDYKGVYRAGRGPVAGRDLPPELPLNPDLHLTGEGLSPSEAAAVVMRRLSGRHS